jgi:CDP-diacylglycerol---glycerol-3-phosphate 3-phosphatidyltransferase
LLGVPSIYQLKPKFQALLRPLVGACANVGITANQVTLAACVISVVVGVSVWRQIEHRSWFLAIPLWLLLRMALNAVDGMLAREFKQQSTLGGYLNELTDVISDAALYAPFALIAGASALGIAMIIGLAALTEFAGVLGVVAGASRRYDGPMGKSDRAFVFGALGLLVGLGVPTGAWFAWVEWALIALLVLTIVNRVRGGLSEARAAPRKG